MDLPPCTHVCTRVCAHVGTHVGTHVYARVYAQVYMHVYAHDHTHVYALCTCTTIRNADMRVLYACLHACLAGHVDMGREMAGRSSLGVEAFV